MHIEADVGHAREGVNICVRECVTDTQIYTNIHAQGEIKRKPHGSKPIKLLIREPVTDGAALYTTLEMALESFPQPPTAIVPLSHPPTHTPSPLLRPTVISTVGIHAHAWVCIHAYLHKHKCKGVGVLVQIFSYL